MDINRTHRNNLQYAVNTIKKRKCSILLCMIGILIPITIYNYTAKPIYEATTMLLYEEDAQSLSFAELFQMKYGINLINDQIKEIKSYALAQSVFEALPESIIATYPLKLEKNAKFDRKHYIMKMIHDRISTNSSLNSNIIELKIEAYTDHAAMEVANTMADELIKRNLNIRKEATSNVRNMIDEQLSVVEKQLNDAELSLKRFKELGKITYIEKESEEIFRRITEAENLYNRTRALYDAAEKRHAVIAKKLATERKDLFPSITRTTSPWAQKLKENLIDLEVQYTTLKVQDYAEGHPKLIKLKEQIEQTKKSLQEETLKITQGETTVDPLSQIQDFLKELITLDIELETNKAQKQALEEIIETYNNHLISVPAKEMQLAQLNREVEVNNQIYTTLLQKKEEARIADAEKIGNIRIVDPPILPEKPVKPKKLLYTVIGLLLGCGLGIGLALFFERMNESIKTIEDLESNLEFTTMGSIPHVKFKQLLSSTDDNQLKKRLRDEQYKLIYTHMPDTLFSDSFRSLRTYVQFIRHDTAIKSIMITSSSSQEGKSLIAANLSIVMAQSGLKTMLIDLDLRKPVQHLLFAKNAVPGITDFLLQDEGAGYSMEIKEDAAKKEDDEIFTSLVSGFSNQTDISNLTLLTSGTKAVDPAAILSSHMMSDVLRILKDRYDLIVIDSAPILPVVESKILSRLIEGVMFVVSSGKSKTSDVNRALRMIKNDGNIIGVILNNMPMNSGSYYYSDEYHQTKRKKKKNKQPSERDK